MSPESGNLTLHSNKPEYCDSRAQRIIENDSFSEMSTSCRTRRISISCFQKAIYPFLAAESTKREHERLKPVFLKFVLPLIQI